MGKKPTTTHTRIFPRTKKKLNQNKLPGETDAEYLDRIVCIAEDENCGKGKK